MLLPMEEKGTIITARGTRLFSIRKIRMGKLGLGLLVSRDNSHYPSSEFLIWPRKYLLQGDLRPIQALGITLVALAALWFVSDQIYMFEIGPGYKGPTISQDINQGVRLLLGGSPQGMTIGGFQLSVVGLVGIAGFPGTIVLAFGGIACIFQRLVRDRLHHSRTHNSSSENS